MVKQSEIVVQGTPVSYMSEFGGMGFGYKLQDRIYRSGGNGFYYPVSTRRVWEDGGEVYTNAVKGKYPPDLFQHP